MIRPAVYADRMRVLAMAKAFHAASGLPFAFSAPMADALFSVTLNDPEMLCLVFEADGQARGILAAQAQAHLFAPAKMAVELIFWIDPNYRGNNARPMLDAYEGWARERGCVYVNLVGLGGDPLTTRLYERRGYQAVERHFMKSL
ncbi:GNAT family N-acetyltransferase [Pararhizobium sp. DWP3-4]|uniref:GNAT family N-acetyltransferase n=1 Tax=Pararhizobium sp. DWP3-4 TaxID=2804565 RepID=UPI003CF4859A